MHKILIIVDQSLFYSLTKLPSQGVPFDDTLVDDWKFNYSSHDARRMVCNDQVDMTGRLLVGSAIKICHCLFSISVHHLLHHRGTIVLLC